ncbi:hypothetical protein FBUS_04119 [Fasciolopsis buskii]|uniref:Uncharacterized protein n=1 Tax=Fasciolopsis buskii TaxID=27845 RepID=A0A8E0VJN2_9TREM|nr:hypothetical protein FBUS_04119 [Fasciolopsis buski]
MCHAKSSMNMTVAAAMRNTHHQISQAHLSPKPQFPGQVIHGQSNQVPSLNAHQANVALAAANSYHAAVAAFAVAAQQYAAPAYFNNPMASNIHSRKQHIQQSVQSPLSVYYTAQPLYLPTHFQRYLISRFPHGSIYHVQGYQQSHQNIALHNPVQQASENPGTHFEEVPPYSTMGGGPRVATAAAYSFLFKPHVHSPQANQFSSNNHSVIPNPTACLHFQCPQKNN